MCSSNIATVLLTWSPSDTAILNINSKPGRVQGISPSIIPGLIDTVDKQNGLKTSLETDKITLILKLIN